MLTPKYPHDEDGRAIIRFSSFRQDVLPEYGAGRIRVANGFYPAGHSAVALLSATVVKRMY